MTARIVQTRFRFLFLGDFSADCRVWGRCRLSVASRKIKRDNGKPVITILLLFG